MVSYPSGAETVFSEFCLVKNDIDSAVAGLLSQYDSFVYEIIQLFYFSFFDPHKNKCVIINQFDPSLTHGIFWDRVTYSTHCYVMINTIHRIK